MQNRIAGFTAFVDVLQLVGLVLVWETLQATWDSVRGSQKQVDIAQEALVSGERLWIEVTSAGLRTFRITGREVFAAASVGIKNVGHGPARHVALLIDLVATDDQDEMDRAAERLCGTTPRSGSSPGEALLFPEQEGRLGGNETKPLPDLLAPDRVAQVAGHLAREAAFDRRAAMEGTGDDDTRSKLSVVGCITYGLQNGKSGRATFVGPIRRVAVTDPGDDGSAIDFYRDISLTAKDVRVDFNPGGFAD